MSHPQATAGRQAFDTVSDDALLLHEFAHRVANEVASAAAAVHLAKRTASGAGKRLLERALVRLEAFGELNRVLARPVRQQVNVSPELVQVCRAIAAGASDAARGAVSMVVPETWVDGGTARRLVLVAAELVANAVRHGLEGRAGRLDVKLEIVGEDVVLEVRDDGPGMRKSAPTSGTGLGGGIVAQLVDRARGTIAIDTGPSGTRVRVALPLRPAYGEDADVAF